MSKMKAILASSALAASALTGVATAEVTGNFGVTSNYIFRGDTQTNNGPAVSGGLDWTGTSGLYAGAWGSNASIDGENEFDIYAGYGIGAGSLTIDLGAIAYLYPGDDVSSAGNSHGNNAEVYVGVAGAAWNVYAWYNNGVNGGTDEDQFVYIEGNASIAAWDFHLGYKLGLGDDFDDGAPGEPEDGAVDFSVAYNIGDFSFGASTKYRDDSAETTERPEFFASWGTEFSVK